MKKVALSATLFIALAGAIGYLVTAGGGARSTGPGGGMLPAASPAVQGRAEAAGGDLVLAPAPATEPGTSGGGAASQVGAIGNLPAIGPDIVKTAEMSVVVKKGGFEDAFLTATMVAGRYGGYVESSSTSGTKSKSGRLLIRVPNASFEQALKDLRGLGTVDGQSISGQDVTSQYVDLQARLRTWEAQESVLLRLMSQATSIEASLRVQRELQDVQFRIEQIKGQLRVLQNQTELATIQVSLREAGAPIVKETAATQRPSLAEAWSRALNGFLGVLYTVVVGLGYLIPITAIALAAWAGLRRLGPRAAPERAP